MMVFRANAQPKARPAKRSIGRRARDFLRNLPLLGLTLLVAAWSTTAAAQAQRFPLEPPDTMSPRGALLNLTANVAEALRVLDAAKRDYASAPGLSKSDEVRAQQGLAETLIARAARSLDLSEVPPAIVEHVGEEAAILLAEVLDRVPLPPAASIPDADAVEAQGLVRWRVPHTAIDIVRVAEGPRAGEFLFSPASVAQAGAMYEAVRHLPYKTHGANGLYERYILTPGRLLPPKWLAWAAALPAWTRTEHYGEPLWKWVTVVLTLTFVVLVPSLVSRWKQRLGEPRSELARDARRLIVPLVTLLALWQGEDFLIQQITFTGQGHTIVAKGLLVPMVIVVAYIAYLLLALVAEIIVSSPRIDDASLDANLIRMIASILGGALALGIVFYGANELGVPLVPLLASLGVGGLAVALAARPTLENLIGSIMLYTDRPVRVGDFCSFGEHTGTVERIGVRSTQVRGSDRTIITVPNATFADMEITNWARCDILQILTTVGLRYETTLDQLRYVLAKIREMCLAHPKIDNDTIRIRFADYGSSSLDIQIRIYALTRDWNEYFAIKEDVLLRVGSIIEEAGTGIAFPSRSVYLGRDGGLDEERGEAAIREVQSWRSTGRLPFPNMADSRRDELADTLDYPPRGSPHASKSEPSKGEAAEPLSTESKSGDESGKARDQR